MWVVLLSCIWISLLYAFFIWVVGVTNFIMGFHVQSSLLSGFCLWLFCWPGLYPPGRSFRCWVSKAKLLPPLYKYISFMLCRNYFLSLHCSDDTCIGRPCLWRVCRGRPLGFYHSHQRGKVVFRTVHGVTGTAMSGIVSSEWGPLKKKKINLAGMNLPSHGENVGAY